jgi:hypothetical protein
MIHAEKSDHALLEFRKRNLAERVIEEVCQAKPRESDALSRDLLCRRLVAVGQLKGTNPGLDG